VTGLYLDGKNPKRSEKGPRRGQRNTPKELRGEIMPDHMILRTGGHRCPLLGSKRCCGVLSKRTAEHPLSISREEQLRFKYCGSSRRTDKTTYIITQRQKDEEKRSPHYGYPLSLPPEE
jgi:hypothetical protein